MSGKEEVTEADSCGINFRAFLGPIQRYYSIKLSDSSWIDFTDEDIYLNNRKFKSERDARGALEKAMFALGPWVMTRPRK